MAPTYATFLRLSFIILITDRFTSKSCIVYNSLILSFQKYIQDLKTMQEKTDSPQVYHVATEVGTSRGRPKLRLEKNQMKFLLDANFSGTDIAKILCVSRATVYDRFK